MRKQFIKTGYLRNTQDTKYRPAIDNLPTFGFALNLGKVGNATKNSLFTINLAQDPVIQFEGGARNQSLPGLWKSYYSSDIDAVSLRYVLFAHDHALTELQITYMYNQYSTETSLSTEIDNQVINDATAAAGSDYLTLTSLAVRQAFGALTYAGTPDITYVFLKEISSDGDIQTVSVFLDL